MDDAKLLALTNEELEKMSSAELEDLLHLAQDKGDEFYTLQIAYKTLINSLYGALGNKAFVLFNEKIAQAITGNGRFFIQSLGRNINDYLQSKIPSDKAYWNYADTDSVYYNIEPFVKKFEERSPSASILEKVDFCHRFSEKVIDPIIQGTIDQFCEVLNARDPSACGAKMEVIADKVIFIAKKKYIARLRESESSVYPVNHPKIKAMGVELIKSTTAPFARKYLNEVIPILLDGTNQDLLEFFKGVKAKFCDSGITDIASGTSVSRLDYDFNKDIIPINSRAAIYYNKYLSQKNLASKYTPIQPGDKIKFVHLRTPNPFASDTKNASGKVIKPNVIAFLEDEFGELLRDYVDYDEQFNKVFISPLKIMTEAIGYTVQTQMPSVFDFF